MSGDGPSHCLPSIMMIHGLAAIAVRRATALLCLQAKSSCGLPACVAGLQRAHDSCYDAHPRPGQVTNDITAYSSADIFSAVGKTTPVAARFSIVTAQRGAPEWTRDPRGFAVKFYTQEGNWDLVGNNFPARPRLAPPDWHAHGPTGSG